MRKRKVKLPVKPITLINKISATFGVEVGKLFMTNWNMLKEVAAANNELHDFIIVLSSEPWLVEYCNNNNILSPFNFCVDIFVK